MMVEIEQKRLYEHFKKLSKDGKDNIQRANATKYAKEILKSFPKFEKPVTLEAPQSKKAKKEEK